MDTKLDQLLALARDGTRSGLPEEEKANVVLDQARTLIRSGRHLAARSLIEEVRRTLPADASPALRARVALNLGACHMYAGDTATAEAEFHAALRSQPDDPKPLINLAVARLVSGDGAGALERSRRARELAPDDADAAAVYLEVLHATGQDVMLETTLQEHASLRTSAHVLAPLGLIRQDQGRHAEAEDLYREAERLDPRTRACRPIGPARSWPKSSRRWKQTRRHSRGAWTRACESGCSRPNNS